MPAGAVEVTFTVCCDRPGALSVPVGDLVPLSVTLGNLVLLSVTVDDPGPLRRCSHMRTHEGLKSGLEIVM